MREMNPLSCGSGAVFEHNQRGQQGAKLISKGPPKLIPVSDVRFIVITQLAADAQRSTDISLFCYLPLASAKFTATMTHIYIFMNTHKLCILYCRVNIHTVSEPSPGSDPRLSEPQTSNNSLEYFNTNGIIFMH